MMRDANSCSALLARGPRVWSSVRQGRHQNRTTSSMRVVRASAAAPTRRTELESTPAAAAVWWPRGQLLTRIELGPGRNAGPGPILVTSRPPVAESSPQAGYDILLALPSQGSSAHLRMGSFWPPVALARPEPGTLGPLAPFAYPGVGPYRPSAAARLERPPCNPHPGRSVSCWRRAGSSNSNSMASACSSGSASAGARCK